jgi:hypothetical protein
MTAKVRSSSAAVPAPTAMPHGPSCRRQSTAGQSDDHGGVAGDTTLTRAICGTPIQNPAPPKLLKIDGRETP